VEGVTALATGPDAQSHPVASQRHTTRLQHDFAALADCLTGSMSRRTNVLDALEPAATASLHPSELARPGIAPGAFLRVETRRGAVELAARADPGISPGSVFVPFAYVEAAANLLTNAALDPFGMIPEFKYCAARVLPVAA